MMDFFDHKNIHLHDIEKICALIQDFYSARDKDFPVSSVCLEKVFKENLLGGKISLDDYLNYLRDKLLPYASHLHNGGFMGHMTSILPYCMVMLAPIVVACNQNVLKTETSRILTSHEREMIGRFHRLIYKQNQSFYQEETHNQCLSLGFMTGGGTLSNLTAIYTALNNSADIQGNRLKYWLKERGKTDVVMIGSEILHYSFTKIAQLTGVSWLKCPVTPYFQIDIYLLKELIAQCRADNKKIVAIIGVAGSTDVGAIDDLFSLSQIAKQEQAHFHVDAAWGGAFILSGKYRHLLSGLAHADTVTLDGHKQLMLPMGSGMIFFKNPKLARVNMQHAPYAVREDSCDIGRFTIEGSRAANSIYLDALLSLIGEKGIDEILQHSMSNTHYLVRQIKKSQVFELMVEPQLNIVLYRYIPVSLRGKHLTQKDNEKISTVNEQLQEQQKKQGKTFVSRSKCSFSGNPSQVCSILRAVMFNPLIRPADIDELLEEQQRIGNAIAV